MFVMLWAYVAFAQFLIIWSGDISEEVPYYISRSAGGWKGAVLVLIVLHFFLPFFLLLLRWTKRKAEALGALALLILALRFVDLFWTVVPFYDQGRKVLPVPGFHLHWLNFIVPAAMG